MNIPRRNFHRGIFFYLASLFAGILTDELYFITLVLMPPLVRPSQVTYCEGGSQTAPTMHGKLLELFQFKCVLILRLLLQQLRLQQPQSHNLPEQR